MCCLLTAACSSDSHEPTAAGNVTVDFSATMAPSVPATRSPANVIDNTTDLKDRGGFGVFGCYTGLHKYVDSNIHPDFMYNEHITSSDGTIWTYNPIKYWPNGEGETNTSIVTGEIPHYVSFMAYAPYSDNITGASGVCIPSFSHQGELGNPWLTYRLHDDVSQQVDLLYATPLLDQTKPAVNTKLNFEFKHALSCVGDKISIICSSGIKNQVASRIVGGVTNAKVVITRFTIKYTLTSKARLVLWNNGSANWQTILSEDPICTRTVNIGVPIDVYSYPSGDSYVIDDKGVYYIPKEHVGYPQTAEVSISYCIATSKDGSTWTNETENEGTATLTLSNYPDAYQCGKHLYLNITLNQMNIGFTAAIAPWVVVDPVDVEAEEE